MSNINKIRLSGTTYDLEDLNAAKTVELTQAEYDALTVKDPNTFYVITDAQAADLSNFYTKSETDDLLDTKLDVSAYTPTDLSNYYTKSETSGATEISTALAGKADTATTYTKTEVDNAITAATSAKQDQLVSGQNLKTVNNQSLLGSGNIEIQGGGASYSAGTNISIDTANTINCTLPISAGTGNCLLFYGDTSNNIYRTSMNGFIFGSQNGTYNPIKSNNPFIIGSWNEATANSPFIHGHSCVAKGLRNFISGYKLNANYSEEAAFGHWNNSVTGSTASGQTLFSVGNGTADNARHNAFEIRHNGDIYISKDGVDVKLQDELGGGGSSYTAGDGIDITNDVISVTGKVDTSAITTSVTSASTDTQVPSAKAVYDALQESGGGSEYSAGTNISIDTANTINCTLPFRVDDSSKRAISLGSSSVASGYNSLAFGDTCQVSGANSFSVGKQTNANGFSSVAFGIKTTTNNIAQASFGNNNITNGNSDYFAGNSGNTLFSVGNGNTDSARHNAFEIRQNGDIYFPDTDNTTYAYFYQKPMVRLQDMYGALGGLKLVKLTQAEYDALVTKDSNTLYVIVN